MPRRVALTAMVSCALVVLTAAPAATDDETVTWDQVRAALDAARAHHPAPTRDPVPPPEPVPGGTTMVLTVTIPDLSWALDDPTAPAGVRRAACHQATRTDDETAAPLAACLAHVGAQP